MSATRATSRASITATSLLRRAVEERPGNIYCCQHLSETLVGLGEMNEAVEVCEEALKLARLRSDDPQRRADGSLAYQLMARLLTDLGRTRFRPSTTVLPPRRTTGRSISCAPARSSPPGGTRRRSPSSSASRRRTRTASTTATSPMTAASSASSPRICAASRFCGSSDSRRPRRLSRRPGRWRPAISPAGPRPPRCEVAPAASRGPFASASANFVVGEPGCLAGETHLATKAAGLRGFAWDRGNRRGRPSATLSC
jgi:hypothetical protein